VETTKLKAHIGSDGILKLEMPVGVRDTDIDVVVVLAPRQVTSQQEWKVFVDETYGSLANDPIQRGIQPPLDLAPEGES
jgi:hypothetical protein